MLSAIPQQQNSLVTVESLYPVLQPYITTVKNAKNHLLTPAQSNGLVLIIVEILMENYTDKSGMKLLASMFNADAYDELCNERIINHYCAYPLCGNYDPAKIKSNNNNKTKLRFLDGYYNNSYCSKLHYQSNEFFKRQLTTEAIFLRTELFQIPENIIFLDDLLEEISDTKNKDKTMLNIIESMRSLSIDGIDSRNDELAGLIKDFEIVENTDLEPPPTEMVVQDGYGLDEIEDSTIRGKQVEGYVIKN